MLDLISLKTFLFQKSSFLLLLYFLFCGLQILLRHHGSLQQDFGRALRNIFLLFLTVLPVTLIFSAWQREIAPQSGLAFWLQLAIALLFFDGLSYFWHWANHKFPILWRFHLWHHLEQHLETTAALRFHSGELILSGFLRMGILYILPLGVSLEAILWYEIIYQGCNFFQHSNLNIGEKAERWISKLLITPGLHRVHHSLAMEDRDRNFGTIFSFWDKIFGTYRWNLAVRESGELGEDKLGSRSRIWWRAWLVWV